MDEYQERLLRPPGDPALTELVSEYTDPLALQQEGVPHRRQAAPCCRDSHSHSLGAREPLIVDA